MAHNIKRSLDEVPVHSQTLRGDNDQSSSPVQSSAILGDTAERQGWLEVQNWHIFRPLPQYSPSG